ncbi:hypothetical protein TREES_T100014244 [Tupaia chinensis]|uniref:CDK5 and ABL1 enzyme substrate 2 n=1 Tax=Tupaia chinensis TaxID=246437 RepID=L9JF29_TUPCH|nr:hypothetical protein TREES_T100014244 [Tupaia chinensis]
MESFLESLNRLKDIHEKEVLEVSLDHCSGVRPPGLQNKLLDLNSERCRDAQRLEELSAKNRQLREQQKALKENLRVLENRLRAGLCDHCMVTQELARKRQQEFEGSHLQSLQRIFTLTTEMNGLKEENEALREEVQRLRGLGDKPRPLAREGTSDPPSPLLLPSPGSWKATTEKPPGGHMEAEEDHLGKPAGHRMSPVARSSPGAHLPEARAPDLSPQRIANQLHGTIAVLRPGATNGTPPPSTSSPPSSSERSLPLDSFLRAPRASTVTYESLKRSLPADRLCLLNRHLPLHLRGTPSSSRAQSLKAGEAEFWEEPIGLLGLRDPRLEGALFLAQQQLRVWAGSARPRGGQPRETPPSSPIGSDSEGPESEVARAGLSTVALPGVRPPPPTGPGSPRRKEPTATQACVPDKPLDLSERTRGRATPRPAGWPGSLSPTIAQVPSPEPRVPSGPPTRRPQALSNGTRGTRASEPEETPSPQEPVHAPGPRPSLPSPGGTGEEARGRPEHLSHPQRPDTAGHPEPSKADVPRPEPDEPDESDTSDSEVGLSAEAGAESSVPGQRPRCFCSTEHGQGLQQKRKRASSLRGRAERPGQLRRSVLRVGPGAALSEGLQLLTQSCSGGPGTASPHVVPSCSMGDSARARLASHPRVSEEGVCQGPAPGQACCRELGGQRSGRADEGTQATQQENDLQMAGEEGLAESWVQSDARGIPEVRAETLQIREGVCGDASRRRVTSQRCSLEFLEDAAVCASAQRTKHTSGSPRHTGLKKTHFIKNMRQYDTKNSREVWPFLINQGPNSPLGRRGRPQQTQQEELPRRHHAVPRRIVLICAKRSLCAAFSVLPYGDGLRVGDLRVDSQKQRHPSGGVSVSSEMVFELEGSDVGDTLEYNPNLLDDPQWPCGKHKRVLIFASYMTTVIEYVKPSDLKKDMNETFREKFPHIRLTLSKIRSLKREMRNLSEECSLEPVAVSMAYVYFEKLVLQGKLNKQNRKLCAGACVLLAAKISGDLRKHDVKQLIDKLEERFRLNRRDLIGFELTVLVALELALYLPEAQVSPHYRRLTQQP